MRVEKAVGIIGAGLAGSEAAWHLAEQGIGVDQVASWMTSKDWTQELRSQNKHTNRWAWLDALPSMSVLPLWP